MKRMIGTVLFVIYAIIAITVTVLLLSFNEYNCSELGGYTVYIVSDDSLEPEFKEGSILIIKSTSDKNIQVGDDLLLYNVINSQEYEVVYRTLDNKIQQGRHITYFVDDGESYYNDYLIGKVDDVTVIEGWGTLLSILESKWGYLFCIVVVSLLLFLQEVFDLIMEIKYGGGKENNASKSAQSSSQPARKRTTTGTATKTKTAGTKSTGTRTTAQPAKTTATRTAKTTTTQVAKATKAVAEEVNNSEDTEVEEG